MLWFHFNSVRRILHVLTVEKFLLHSAAEFVGKRKFFYFIFKDGRNSVAFFIGKIGLQTPIERVVLATDRGFETHKVCHSNKQKTLPPVPPNRFFHHAHSGYQPQPGSSCNDQGRQRRETLGTRLTQGECYHISRHETVNYDALSMTRLIQFFFLFSISQR